MSKSIQKQTENIGNKGQKDMEEAKINSKFGSFLKSFLVDVILFTAALVMMIIMLVVIYTVCGQSKLKH